MVTISAPIYQSQPCLTIHHTNEERLEGLRCCEMSESVCTRSMLVWNIGAWYRNFHHLWLKSRGVVMVIHDEFQSPPSPIIHYTYNDILEGLGWLAPFFCYFVLNANFVLDLCGFILLKLWFPLFPKISYGQKSWTDSFSWPKILNRRNPLSPRNTKTPKLQTCW